LGHADDVNLLVENLNITTKITGTFLGIRKEAVVGINTKKTK
jgi:hypothetical protein